MIIFKHVQKSNLLTFLSFAGLLIGYVNSVLYLLIPQDCARIIRLL